MRTLRTILCAILSALLYGTGIAYAKTCAVGSFSYTGGRRVPAADPDGRDE